MTLLIEKTKRLIDSHSGWWKDYMKEISILVISLAATFYGESLIQSYQEAQEDHQTMEMVVDELEYNQETLEALLKQYTLERQFAVVLKRALVEHQTVPKDTLKKYTDFHYDIYYSLWKHNALDLIKLSGAMQRISDKTLSLRLFECYEWLAVVKEMDINFREERKQKRTEFVSHLENGLHAETAAEQWRQIDRDEAFKNYLLYSMPATARTIYGNADAAHAIVGETIEMIREAYKLPKDK